MTNQISLFSDRVGRLLESAEHERLEFKEAKERFDFEELTKLCAAIANEGGGHLLLGVNNSREVVGSNAFSDLGRTKMGLSQRLFLRIGAEAVQHPNGRVVIIHVPSSRLLKNSPARGKITVFSGG